MASDSQSLSSKLENLTFEALNGYVTIVEVEQTKVTKLATLPMVRTEGYLEGKVCDEESDYCGDRVIFAKFDAIELSIGIGKPRVFFVPQKDIVAIIDGLEDE